MQSGHSLVPKLSKVGTIGAHFGPSGHYRGYIWSKGGFGLVLDTLSCGKSGIFPATVDKTKGSSGQLGRSSLSALLSSNDPEHPTETFK